MDPEAIDLSNTAYAGYYTSAQTRMYIGDVFIDELNSIEWGLNHNVVPLYGYCSRDADAYAWRARLAEVDQMGAGNRSAVIERALVEYIAKSAGIALTSEPHDSAEGRSFELVDPTGFPLTVFSDEAR